MEHVRSDQEVRREVREWLVEHWDPTVPPREWGAMVVDSGWACPSWSEEWFGRGLPGSASRAVIDEFANVGATGAGHDLANLYAATIYMHGSDDTKHRLLRSSLTGEFKFCLLYSEPAAGSDLAGVQTTAVRDGDDWVVNGQKVWTSIGPSGADFGMLLARTDWHVPKRRGLSYFVLPMRQPGVEIRPIRMATGQSHFNEVFLTDTRAPHADLLGEAGGGWAVMQTALAYERAHMAGAAPHMFPRSDKSRAPSAWDALAGATTDLAALARAHGRADDATIRQELARVHTLKMLNGWNDRRARAERKAGRTSRAAGLGKLAMSDILHSAARTEAAILGASALVASDGTEGRRCELALLNAFVNSIGGGTDQIQRNILGERVLGLPRGPELDSNVPFVEVQRSRR